MWLSFSLGLNAGIFYDEQVVQNPFYFCNMMHFLVKQDKWSQSPFAFWTFSVWCKFIFHLMSAQLRVKCLEHILLYTISKKNNAVLDFAAISTQHLFKLHSQGRPLGSAVVPRTLGPVCFCAVYFHLFCASTWIWSIIKNLRVFWSFDKIWNLKRIGISFVIVKWNY